MCQDVEVSESHLIASPIDGMEIHLRDRSYCTQHSSHTVA